MRKGKHCSLKVRSVYLLVILKMSKVTNFFNHILMKLLLEEMLNLMKISWPARLIRHFVPSLACEPNLAIVPSSACKPSSTFVPSYDLVFSSDDDNEDENPSLPAHPPPNESFELEPTLAPPLPRWVRSTQEAVGDLVGDPSDQCWTRS
jgi:hypothetical protein